MTAPTFDSITIEIAPKDQKTWRDTTDTEIEPVCDQADALEEFLENAARTWWEENGDPRLIIRLRSW